MDVSGHLRLARRAAQFVQSSSDGPSDEKLIISPLALFVIPATVLIYYAMIFMVRYSIGAVISTLTIVEEPESQVIVEIDSFDDDDINKKPTDQLLEPEVTVVQLKPVTTKIRTAMKLLKQRGGRFGRFRGLGLFILYGFLKKVIVLPLAGFMPLHFGYAFASIIAETLLAGLEMAWVHHVISEPSVHWTCRLRPFGGGWTKIAPAAFKRAVALQLTIGLPAAFLCTSRPFHEFAHHPFQVNNEFDVVQLRKATLVLAVSVISAFALMILVFVPAHVSFIRVAASMLPEEEQTMVTFDRSFGGRVFPAAEGGSGKIGMLDAWKTFTWEQRRRFVLLMVKIIGIMTALSLFFFVIIATEAIVFTKGGVVPLVKQGLKM